MTPRTSMSLLRVARRVPGRADLEPGSRAPGPELKPKPIIGRGSLEEPAGPLPWPSLPRVWTASGEIASKAWWTPPCRGQLSQGLKPLALFQLPEVTPPSSESQDRTSGGGLAPPLPDPMPRKQPDLATAGAHHPSSQSPLLSLSPLPRGRSWPWES